MTLPALSSAPLHGFDPRRDPHPRRPERSVGLSPRAAPRRVPAPSSRAARAHRPLPVLRGASRRPRRAGPDEAPRAPRSPHADARRRAGAHRRSTARHGVAVVDQGDRHRGAMRSACRRAHRAGQVLALPGRPRASGNARRGPRSSAARPHDPGPSLSSRRGGGALRPHRRRAGARDRHRGRGPRRTGGGERDDGTRPRRGGDRASAARVHRARAQSPRCRAHDVRPDQLRALPPQDLQRNVDGGRGSPGPHPLRDDPEHAGEATRRGALRLPRQRRGHRGRPRAVAGARTRYGSLPRPRDTRRHRAQGGDPQPPDRHLSLPGRRDRGRRRDPR